MKRVRNLILGANLAVIIATVTAYLSPQIHPETSVVPGLLSLAFPLLLILNILFAVGWLVARSYFSLLSLAVIVLGWNAVVSTINLSPDAQSDGQVLKVATLNFHHMIDLNEDQLPSQDQIQEVYDKMGRPDVLCLQESGAVQRYQDALGFKHYHRLDNKYNVLFTNFEIIDHEVIEPGPGHTRSGWYDLNVYGDTIRLFHLYLASNRITAQSEELMEEGSLQDGDSWRQAGSILGRYARASKIRAHQAQLIRESIDVSPYPVLVCGDFNDVPLSYSVVKVQGGLSDTFVEKGRGTGTSYAGKLRGLRIDYIMVDEDFDVLTHRTPRLDISDHYPVIAEIRITDL